MGPQQRWPHRLSCARMTQVMPLLLCACLLGLPAALAAQAVVGTPDVTCQGYDSLYQQAVNDSKPNSHGHTVVTVQMPQGCSTFKSIFSCLPIVQTTVFQGDPAGGTVWDAALRLFQFAAQDAANITLKDMKLINSLVFTRGYSPFQPATFHLLNGSFLHLQNVEIVTSCSTLKYYQLTSDNVRDKMVITNSSIRLISWTERAVSLQNVTITCDLACDPQSVEVYSHSYGEWANALNAISNLTLDATIRMAQNLTLPYIDPDGQQLGVVPVINSDVTIVGDPGTLVWIDSQFTNAMVDVQQPSLLTLQNVVLTNLLTAEWSTGIGDGVLLGVMPFFAIGYNSKGLARLFTNTTIVVAPYEVRQMQYWCTVSNLLSPEAAHLADWLRVLVYKVECEIIDEHTVIFRLLKTAGTNFVDTVITSVVPPGVPQQRMAGMDPILYPEPHANPPLVLAGSAQEMVDRMAPLSPPAPDGISYIQTTDEELPLLILLNNAIVFSPEMLVGADGGPRIMTQSAIITCYADGTPYPTGCGNVVIDWAGLDGGLKLGSPNMTLTIENIGFRNLSDAMLQNLVGGRSTTSSHVGVFEVDGVAPRIYLESVTFEASPAQFKGLINSFANLDPRRPLYANSNAELLMYDDKLIQLISFTTPGVRGAWINITLGQHRPDFNTGPPVDPNVAGAPNTGSHTSHRATIGVVVGAVLGGVLVAALVAALVHQRHRRTAAAKAAHDLSTVSIPPGTSGTSTDVEAPHPADGRERACSLVVIPGRKDSRSGLMTGSAAAATMSGKAVVSSGKLVQDDRLVGLEEGSSAQQETPLTAMAGRSTDGSGSGYSSSYYSYGPSLADTRGSKLAGGLDRAAQAGESPHASSMLGSALSVPEPTTEVQRLITELRQDGQELTILQPIGAGGFGTVYKGIWRNLEVAVKTVLFQDKAANTHNQSAPASVVDAAAVSCTFPTPPPSAPCSFLTPDGVVTGPMDSGTPSHSALTGPLGAAVQHSLVSATASVPHGDKEQACSHQRAVLEAAVSCSVSHPNVVATYHFDITPIRAMDRMCQHGLMISERHSAPSDWKLYLIQEYCDAGSLAAALDHRMIHDQAGVPNLVVLLSIMCDIARGMSHIHSRNVIHGDLNPTNILLKRGNQSATSGDNLMALEFGIGITAKIADFGLCATITPEKAHASNIKTGTPFYAAPEVVSTGCLTKASDLYSYGVLLWELYTGTPPFVHTPQGFQRCPGFPDLPPNTPSVYKRVTAACLAAAPDARPSFDQVLSQLQTLQHKLQMSLQSRMEHLAAAAARNVAPAVQPPHAMAPPPPAVPASWVTPGQQPIPLSLLYSVAPEPAATAHLQQ